MKSMFKLPLVAVAFAIAIPFTFAQDAGTPPPPPPPGEQGPGGPGGPGKAQRGDRFKMMVEQLKLTEDQKAKIKPILEEDQKAMKALREDQSLDKATRRQKREEIIKRSGEQVRPLLTPEQQKTFDEIKDSGPGGMKEGKEKK